MTSVTVYLHNETDYPMALTDAPADGDWTGSPPSSVAPHDVAVFGTESDNFTVGTEGRATYQIGDDPGATVYTARRNGPSDAQGLADLITARLSPRPDDPIWDPDPDLRTAITAALADDPRTLELDREATQLREVGQAMWQRPAAPAAPRSRP